MRLKIATTISVIVGLALIVAWPFLLGPRPPSGPEHKRETAEYALRLLLYFGITAFVWLAVAVLAWLMLRQARQEFASEKKALMRELVEGTLQDHERKKS